MEFNLNKFNTILEIGVNHEGSVDNAIKIMKLGADLGGKIFKFQSYTPSKYISSSNSERFDRVKKFSLSIDDFRKIKQQADNLNVTVISTPLSEDWVNPLAEIFPAIKIASGDITFKPVLKLAAQSNKPIILSTGASSIDEIDEAVEYISSIIGKDNLKHKLCLLHCISAYPTPIEQANLRSIPFLKDRYNLNVGYSNHVIGINACLTAIALGADLVEVHFTDDKNNRNFHDHALSFDPNDLKRYFSESKDVFSSLGQYDKFPQDIEKDNIDLLRKGIVASKNLKKGQILCIDDLNFARPATEFSSNKVGLLIGKKINKDLLCGELIKKVYISDR